MIYDTTSKPSETRKDDNCPFGHVVETLGHDFYVLRRQSPDVCLLHFRSKIRSWPFGPLRERFGFIISGTTIPMVPSRTP